MTDTSLQVPYPELHEKLLPRLRGRAFHVTCAANIAPIAGAGAILSNGDGRLATTFGSSSRSFFRRRACVSVFDYRDLTHEQLDAALGKCAPWQAGRTCYYQLGIYFLSAEACTRLQSSARWREEAAWSEMTLQQKTDELKAATEGSTMPFTFGSHDTLPKDRTPIRTAGFYTSTNGDDVHEGTVVQTVAFLLHGAYSNTGTGEGVNCGIHGVESNDIHLALARTKTEPDECNSFTAEISPHFRPAEWLILSSLHKTSSKTAAERIAAMDRSAVPAHWSDDARRVP